MKTIAIIPARSGSKGIPRKNLAVLAGRPLICHTIECAKEAKCFDKIIVSTDDSDIELLSTLCKVDTIMRPTQISKDHSPIELTIFHAIEILDKQKYCPDIIVLLNPTSPLRKPRDITGCLDYFKQAKADSAISVTQAHEFFWKIEKNNAKCISHDISKIRPMRQEMTNFYKEAGGIFIMTKKGFIRNTTLLFGKIVAYIIPESRSIDINIPIDLEYAELLMK
jgi:N-acylneuraminate cytidylyltransferase